MLFPVFAFIVNIFFTDPSIAMAGNENSSPPDTSKKHIKPCRVSYFFKKNICSNIENNKPSLVRYQLQKRSNMHSSAKLFKWTRQNYRCIKCRKEPGFSGGSMLRKVVFENATKVAHLLVVQIDVDMDFFENDRLTLLDWLLLETERTFEQAFEAENELDKKWLMRAFNNYMDFYKLFRENGARFGHELEST